MVISGQTSFLDASMKLSDFWCPSLCWSPSLRSTSKSIYILVAVSILRWYFPSKLMKLRTWCPVSRWHQTTYGLGQIHKSCWPLISKSYWEKSRDFSGGIYFIQFTSCFMIESDIFLGTLRSSRLNFPCLLVSSHGLLSLDNPWI